MRILFVCMGNICRSPTAEGVFRKLVTDAGLQDRIHVESAGTHGYHVGAPPDRRAASAARARGFDLSGIEARRVSPDDFDQFDLIVALDSDNYGHLSGMAPRDARAEIRRLMDFASEGSGRDVPDPYYGGLNGFELVLDMVEDACAGLLREASSRLGRMGHAAGQPGKPPPGRN
ncbi:MAG: low molecular weight phosphotyrosine protein phosphatase [Gammaproteobacteria bacterium]